MGERERENKKSLKDRAQEVIQSVVDALESLVPQQGELMPIPARGRRPIRR